MNILKKRNSVAIPSAFKAPLNGDSTTPSLVTLMMANSAPTPLASGQLQEFGRYPNQSDDQEKIAISRLPNTTPLHERYHPYKKGGNSEPIVKEIERNKKIHKQLEQNRRTDITRKFNALKGLLPTIASTTEESRSSILDRAIARVTQLQQQVISDDFESEFLRLKKERDELRTKLDESIEQAKKDTLRLKTEFKQEHAMMKDLRLKKEEKLKEQLRHMQEENDKLTSSIRALQTERDHLEHVNRANQYALSIYENQIQIYRQQLAQPNHFMPESSVMNQQVNPPITQENVNKLSPLDLSMFDSPMPNFEPDTFQ